MALICKHHGRTGRKRCRRITRPVSCDEDVKTVKLRQWMKQQSGFKCPLVPALFSDTGRGLMTKKKIVAGEIILSLPYNLLITTTTVLQSEIGHMIKRWIPKLMPQQCLAVFLIWEKHKQMSSTWFPYIEVLPPSFTTPAYFSETELSFLPKSVRLKAQQECDKIRTMYDGVREFSRKEWNSFYDILTFDSFRWSWCVINTRCVFYKSRTSAYLSDAEPDDIALAPFLDLINHSPNANISAGFDALTNCYEIKTFDNYRPYDQVFISYGAHSNQRLFLEYGFCVPDNHQDEFEFNYDDIVMACQTNKVKHIQKKLEILRENNLLRSLSCSMDGLSWKLWTTFKTLAMNWEELQHWVTVYSNEDAFGDTVSMATSIAKYLLNQYLHENDAQEKLIIKESTELENSEHLEIAKTLIIHEKLMLTTSLHKL